MKTSILSLTILALLAACQESSPTAVPADPRMQPDGTCRANLIHPSLVAEYVPYGSFCPVPAELRTPHKDGSLPAAQYGAGVAFQTWETDDGDCEPRAAHVSNVVAHAACLKPAVLEVHRWLFDTAYVMPDTMSWGY